jgi:SAM-dependent methyltransferase
MGLETGPFIRPGLWHHPRRMSRSRRPDKRELYRWAVQDPRAQVTFLARIYERYAGRWPGRLREDFAGNAADAVDWLALGGELAVAVDIDGPTLRWGERRARRVLGDRAQRLQIVEADVREVRPPAVPSVDVVAALNFSPLVFHTRQDLLAYATAARRGLRRNGVLVLNVFGGVDMMRPRRERRVVRGRALYAVEPPLPPFEYEWEQRSYDARTARLDCRLHFKARGDDGRPRVWRNAFRYDCRLWTLPELLEVLADAGFSKAEVWQHFERRGRAVFEPVSQIEGKAWIAYVVGVR